ncbi:MAG: decaprenyl-phosphate phosphoribosyltransferase [Candidatus Krumholzibacteria bacterium]|nr:decaprenyl-phosphate phosphoribosyltransferase [Candidatus Krumholzibacteria bacterium]
MKKLWYIIVSMRPRQWTKNLVLFAGIVFSMHLFDLSLLERSFYGFLVFCLMSGAVYIINDVSDRTRDREHPAKKKRPIAAGSLSPAEAFPFAVILIAVLLAVSWVLGREFFIVTAAFSAINFAYSFFLRGIVILDVFSISFNFLLRAVGGVAVLKTSVPLIEISPWLLICTLFLSLFLAFCKRRNEIVFLEEAQAHRTALKDYSVLLLDQLVGLSATTALVSYSIYTVWPSTVEKFGTSNLVYTIPFVVFGIMRYLYIVYRRNEGGDPSGILLTEKSILAAVFLWAVTVIWILWRV